MGPGEATGLELRLLGVPALVRDGEAVALPASKKTRALLAFLALASRPERRERICAMFWEVPDDPRGSLRWSLSKLRGVLEADGCRRVIADRETIALDRTALTVDMLALAALHRGGLTMAATAALEAAAQGGDFLEGLDLPRCDDFQAWCVAQREDARRLRTAVLQELVKRPIAPEQALEHARRWTQLDPYGAEAHVALVELLDATGRRAEAEHQRELAMGKLKEADAFVPPELRTASVRREREPENVPRPLPIQHVRFCTASDGTGIAYSVVGEGPPLVKTANWLNHLEFDWESPVWRHWLAALGRDRMLVRYDERGNGLSDWNTKDISFDAFVDDLEAVVDAAGLDRFDLLGVSQGCSVSIAYSIRHPERVRRMVLYGGYAAGWEVRALPGEAERRRAMMTLTLQGWGQNNPAFRQMFTTLFFPDATPAEMEWFNELQRMTTSPRNAERLQAAFGAIDVRAMLPQVSVPTLVMHVRDDAVIPFDAGRGMAAAIPNARFVALESRNHLMLESEPAWTRFVTCLREFLEE